MKADYNYAGNLAGYRVLVTGGGTGIGKACAIELVADGAAVTITGRRDAVLEEAAEEIRPRAGVGGSVTVCAGDVTQEADVQSMVATAAGEEGVLDACIANAGGGGMLYGYESMDTEEFLRVLHLNVLGTMLCVKNTLELLKHSGRGSFVGMSSLAGELTHPWFGAYPVAKAGIEAMMRNAADENGTHGVRFNAIRPGFIATEIMAGIPRDGDTYDSYVRNTPLGEIGEPEYVGRLARFLVGPESEWITGQCINVDGGHSLRRGPDFSAFKF